MKYKWNKFLIFLFIWSLFFVLCFSSSRMERQERDLTKKKSEVFLGKWECFMKGGRGEKIQIVFEILKNEDNTLRCLISMPLTNFTYSGSLKEDQQTIEGVLKRTNDEVKMNLKKIDKISSPLRPQTPKKPYPYNELEVKFPTLHDDVILAGTLTYPKSGEPFPTAILSKVKCPVLALGGKKDIHIPSSQNLKVIEEILQKAGNKNYKIMEFPNLNHLFQTANTGLPMEYSLIEETIAPIALKTIADWIVEQVK